MPLQILILDDEFSTGKLPVAIKTMKRFLETKKLCGQECEVHYVATGTQVLEYLRNQDNPQIDLFICDGDLGKAQDSSVYGTGPSVVEAINKAGDVTFPRQIVAWSATLQSCEDGFNNVGVLSCFKKHGYQAKFKEILESLKKDRDQMEPKKVDAVVSEVGESYSEGLRPDSPDFFRREGSAVRGSSVSSRVPTGGVCSLGMFSDYGTNFSGTSCATQHGPFSQVGLPVVPH